MLGRRFTLVTYLKIDVDSILMWIDVDVDYMHEVGK